MKRSQFPKKFAERPSIEDIPRLLECVQNPKGDNVPFPMGRSAASCCGLHKVNVAGMIDAGLPIKDGEDILAAFIYAGLFHAYAYLSFVIPADDELVTSLVTTQAELACGDLRVSATYKDTTGRKVRGGLFKHPAQYVAWRRWASHNKVLPHLWALQTVRNRGNWNNHYQALWFGR